MNIRHSALLILFLVPLFVVPGCVFAHATPITYTPDAGTTELNVPREVSIEFTERIEPDASSISVFGPEGQIVGVGNGAPHPEDGRIFTVGLLGAEEGVYTVSWQVVSVDDGHFTKGAHSFLVDSTGKLFEGDAGGVEITYVTRLPEAVFNFLTLIGESIFLGALFILLLFLWPLYLRDGKLGDEDQKHLRFDLTHLVIFGFFFLLLGTLATIVRKTTELAALQTTSFGDALGIYLESAAGSSLAIKILVSSLFLGGFLVFQKALFERRFYVWLGAVLLLLIGVLLFLQSHISHAAAAFFHPEVAVAVTVVHLFAKELVIGIALTLTVLLGSILYSGLIRKLPRLLAWYDLLVGGLILLAGVSGAYVSWLHLKSFSNLHTSEWGERFLILLLITVILGGFRIFHQFIVHPRVGQNDFWKRILKVTLPVEVMVGLAVLFISGYISITTPPFTVEKFTYTEEMTAGGVTFVLDVHPYDAESMRLTLHPENGGAEIEEGNLILTLTNDTFGIGPNVIHAEQRFSGGYTFPRNAFSPPGEWHLMAIYQRNGAYDAQGEFTIVYPDEVLATAYSDQDHAFGPFAIVFVWIAGLIALMSAILIAHAYYRVRKVRDVNKDSVLPLTVTYKIDTTLTIILCLIVASMMYAGYFFVIQTSFEKLCIADGNDWRQTFSVRDFEVISKNAENGCWTHGGHQHFIDDREYRWYIDHL